MPCEDEDSDQSYSSVGQGALKIGSKTQELREEGGGQIIPHSLPHRTEAKMSYGTVSQGTPEATRN